MNPKCYRCKLEFHEGDLCYRVKWSGKHHYYCPPCRDWILKTKAHLNLVGMVIVAGVVLAFVFTVAKLIWELR